MSNPVGIDLQKALNNSMPIADKVKLGDLLNDLVTNHNALLAKLDADTGVTGTDYAATLTVSGLTER